MYMFSSIVLLYAHTAPAWSGILALLGTGSGGIVLYIIKLASGDPETEESQDSPPTKKLSAVLSPLSRNESIMRSLKVKIQKCLQMHPCQPRMTLCSISIQ